MRCWVHRDVAIATLAGFCSLIGPHAMAQMPPDIAAKVAALGRVVDAAGTAQLSDQLLEFIAAGK